MATAWAREEGLGGEGEPKRATESDGTAIRRLKTKRSGEENTNVLERERRNTSASEDDILFHHFLGSPPPPIRLGCLYAIPDEAFSRAPPTFSSAPFHDVRCLLCGAPYTSFRRGRRSRPVSLGAGDDNYSGCRRP